MKRPLIFSILLIFLLAACSPSGSGAECKEGICISIMIEGPVQALVPARFVISVKTEKDISQLPIGLTIFPEITISDIEKIPENAKLVYQDHTMLSWVINTKGGTEYSLTGHIVLAKPTVSYGIFNYSIMAYFSQPTFGRVTDSITIYLDSSGKQVEEGNAKSALQTDFPAPTPPPNLTIVPETPLPTVAWPTATPPPSPTPSQLAYPGPEKQMSTEGANEKLPLPSPTQAAYPKP
jgi:hypothetical protein